MGELFLREVFDHFDPEVKGYLDKPTLAKAICACTGHCLSRDELSHAVDKADEHNNGTIDLRVFSNVMATLWFKETPSKEELDAELLAAFRVLDPSNEGSVDAAAFREGLMSNAEPSSALSEKEVDDLLRGVEVDKQGRMQYHQIIKSGILG